MKEGMPVQFPAVTVCNIAAWSLTKLNNLWANHSEVVQWVDLITYTDFKSHSARMRSNQGLFENLPDFTRKLTYDITDFVVHCRFNQKECGPLNFTLYFDGKHYYNCFTFNSGFLPNNKTRDKNLLMHTTGPQNGLSLIISLNNDESIPGSMGEYITSNHVAFGAGVRAQVHAPNTMPSPADHGFDIPPGYSSSVGLKAVLHSRLPYPHGNCTRGNLQSQHHVYKNTIFTCLQLCKQRKLVEWCGCRTSALPMYNDKDADSIPYCGTIKNWITRFSSIVNTSFEIESLQCEQNLLKNLANDRSYEAGCNCFQPCEEVTYEKSLSLSYWPLEFYQQSALQEFYKNRNHVMPTKQMQQAYDTIRNITDKYVQMRNNHIYYEEYNKTDLEELSYVTTIIHQNLLRLNIYLEELSIVEFAQIPAYGLEDLFADIGGTLGLWMGISVLTIVELIELIIRLVSLLFNAETDVTGVDSGGEEVPENQTMLDYNGISQSNKYDQFQYDRPIYQKQQYNQPAESPI